MKFNLNDRVRVRLTNFGRETLKSKGKEYLIKEHEGWSEWQLWVLMEELGPYIHIGINDQPIETEIEILV